MSDAVDDWKRLGRCESSNCPEVSFAGGRVLLRSSHRPAEVVTFTAAEWETLTAAVRDGEFDA